MERRTESEAIAYLESVGVELCANGNSKGCASCFNGTCHPFKEHAQTKRLEECRAERRFTPTARFNLKSTSYGFKYEAERVPGVIYCSNSAFILFMAKLGYKCKPHEDWRWGNPNVHFNCRYV